VAAKLRGPDLTLPSAVRWLRRRVRPVSAAIAALLAGGMCGMSGVFVAKGFLEQLRRDLDTNTLAELPAPLGWRRRRSASDSVAGKYQHEMGLTDLQCSSTVVGPLRNYPHGHPADPFPISIPRQAGNLDGLARRPMSWRAKRAAVPAVDQAGFISAQT